MQGREKRKENGKSVQASALVNFISAVNCSAPNGSDKSMKWWL